jgi:hypothetical protein
MDVDKKEAAKILGQSLGGGNGRGLQKKKAAILKEMVLA